MPKAMADKIPEICGNSKIHGIVEGSHPSGQHEHVPGVVVTIPSPWEAAVLLTVLCVPFPVIPQSGRS